MSQGKTCTCPPLSAAEPHKLGCPLRQPVPTPTQSRMHEDGTAAVELLHARGYKHVLLSFATEEGEYRTVYTGGLAMRSLHHYADRALSSGEEARVNRATTMRIGDPLGGGAGGTGWNGGAQ